VEVAEVIIALAAFGPFPPLSPAACWKAGVIYWLGLVSYSVYLLPSFLVCFSAQP